MQDAYTFSEDSELLSECLRKIGPFESYLEIGMGCGGNLREFSGNFSLAVGTDIQGITLMKELVSSDYEIVIADGASCFRPAVFDLVAFNPPYLPSEEIVDKSVDGGTRGIEIPLAFLEGAIRVSRSPHRIVTILSSFSDIATFESICKAKGLKFNIIGQKKLFFESLFGILVSEP